MSDTPTDPLLGQPTGVESSLSTWAGPYVTEMLGRGQGLAGLPYAAYMGPLTAGPSDLQQQAFQGLGSLSAGDFFSTYNPTSFTDEGVAQQFMTPYLQAALEPQIAEARRQAEIERVQNAGRMTRAGSYGGSRQAIMESELDRNLLRNLKDITGTGYQTAYEQAANQFNAEEDRLLRASMAGSDMGTNLARLQADLGGMQRDIESEGVAADYAQFKEERDYPYKQVQFMQSLLQGLPLGTQSYSYMEPSGLAQAMGTAGGIWDLLSKIYTPTTA